MSYLRGLVHQSSLFRLKGDEMVREENCFDCKHDELDIEEEPCWSCTTYSKDSKWEPRSSNLPLDTNEEKL